MQELLGGLGSQLVSAYIQRDAIGQLRIKVTGDYRMVHIQVLNRAVNCYSQVELFLDRSIGTQLTPIRGGLSRPLQRVLLQVLMLG
jgi:hypothetical protein